MAPCGRRTLKAGGCISAKLDNCGIACNVKVIACACSLGGSFVMQAYQHMLWR